MGSIDNSQTWIENQPAMNFARRARSFNRNLQVILFGSDINTKAAPPHLAHCIAAPD